MTPEQISTFLKLRSAALKKLRREKKVSKYQVATGTGLSRNTIDTMETGEKGWNVVSEIIYTNFLFSLP